MMNFRTVTLRAPEINYVLYFIGVVRLMVDFV